MNELISVIVPVYNSEKYLSHCIESISKQSYSELDIILVDDGSTDNSEAVYKQWAEKDSRIRVIVKGNEGAARARNTGILAARGELVYFVDSDDYIEPDMLSTMYEIMKRESSDCVISSFRYVTEDGTELPWYTPQLSKYQTMSGIEAARIFLTTFDIEGFSWNKLIRKKLIQNYDICFDESKTSYEDMFGIFKIVLCSDRVSFYNARPYYYRQHDVSCVHTMSLRKIEDYKNTILQISELGRSYHLYQESEFFYFYRMMLRLFDDIKEQRSYGDKWKEIEKIYGWNDVFNIPLRKIYQLFKPYIKDNKLKIWIKVFVVWLKFK